jgi:hypothetical protein
MIFLSRHLASAMKSSKMWHRNSYVHPLDASRGPAQRKVVLGGRLHEVRYVLKHKTCNSFGVNHHAFQQLARILGKAWHLKLWVFFSLSDRHCWLSVSWTTVHAFGCVFLFKIKNWALWIWKLDPQATYSRRDPLVIGKWMLDTEEKGCQKRRREN